MGRTLVTVGQRPGAVAAGLLVGLVVSDPPSSLHPVAWFGTAMTAVERSIYRDAVMPGVAYAGVGAGLARLAAMALPSTSVATAMCSAGRGLIDSALEVERRLVDGDVSAARRLLPTLAGRDPSRLDEAGLARAVVESVAENTVDAVVAPAWWALAAGSSGVLVHRAINTMDAMVGHRSPRYLLFGRAAARLDDVAAWLPARLTALLVAAVRPVAAGRVLDVVRRQAPAHPSPNAGVAEGAYAAALGVQLGGTTYYDGRADERPVLGDGRSPRVADIRRATRLCRDITLAMVTVLAAASVRTGTSR